MKSSYEILLEKLRHFILKYYKNEIIKGLILGLALIISFFLFITGIEYFAWSNTSTRLTLYFSFLGLSLFVLIYYIFTPILRMFHLGKTLSETEAARLIGQYFPEVSDKLLNTIQLHADQNSDQLDLLTASINQKAAELAPVPFKKAIDFKRNKKYLKYILPPVLLLLILVGFRPDTITNPTSRIINYNTVFEKPLPYTIRVVNNDLSTIQKSDFILEVEVSGEAIPESITINDGLYSYRMGEMGSGKYQYIFKTLNQDVHFTLNTPEYKSASYHIQVFPRPLIYGFEASLSYPKYLSKPDELIQNTGDLVVPEGTQIQWKFFTKDADSVLMKINDSLLWLTSGNSNTFVIDQKILNSLKYTISPINKFIHTSDSLIFSVQVIPDEYPTIKAQEFQEEDYYGQTHFTGEISDDHGFYNLTFLFRKDSVPQLSWSKISLPVETSILRQSFDFSFNAQEMQFSPGESLSYCIEVRDNDAINGYKKSRSTVFYMQLPDADELANKADNQSDEVKKKIEASLTQLEKLNKQIEETTLSLFEKKDLSWMDKKKLSDLLEKETALKTQMDEIKELNKEIDELESLINKKIDPELQQKMDLLQELFDELMKTDLEKELEKLQEQMDNLDKNKLEDFLKEMKEKNESLKENLEQNLELFKQYEVEKKIEEALEKLEELSKEQLDLADQTLKKELDNEKSLERQEEIQKSFEEMQKDLSEIDSLDQQLEQPFDIKKDTAAINDIEEEMDKASENLEKNKEKKASENQKSAGEKMKEMADSMKMAFEGAKAEQMGEDAEQVRTLLDNLIDMSFEQELLINKISNTSQNDPQYIDNSEKLKLLQTDFVVVEDSLKALSKRQIFIQPFILDESGKITSNIEKALKSLQERRTGEALSSQQYALTSTNNLSLMLAESLNQMKSSMQMSGQKNGQGQCNSPGAGKKPSLEDIMEGQKKLGERMKKNGKKEGEEGSGGVNGNSQELARMAAMQGEIRKQLQDLIDEMEAEGQNGNSLNKIAEEMQKTEEDLIHRQFRQETLERQKEIETRLLRSKEAMQEREKEKKRESAEGKNRQNRNLNQQLKYKDIDKGQEEILLTVPIEVSPYYLNLYKKYLFKLENEKNDSK
jgi:hypothetical protein